MGIASSSAEELKKLAETSEYVSVFEHNPPMRLHYPGKPNHGWVWYGKIIGSIRRDSR